MTLTKAQAAVLLRAFRLPLPHRVYGGNKRTLKVLRRDGYITKTSTPVLTEAGRAEASRLGKRFVWPVD